jgi:hypothetical protein
MTAPDISEQSQVDSYHTHIKGGTAIEPGRYTDLASLQHFLDFHKNQSHRNQRRRRNRVCRAFVPESSYRSFGSTS